MKTLVLAFLVLAFSTPAISQDGKAVGLPSPTPTSISGTISDPNGALVPGATVTARDNTGKVGATTTDIEGKYRLDLPPGEYVISIAAHGFKKMEYQNLRIGDSTSGKMNFDFVLEVGSPLDAPCGYGGACFDDLFPEPIKSNAPAIDIEIRPRPVKPRAAAAQDEEEITLPDRVMEQVVKRIVTWYFKPARRPRTVYFADYLIKQQWMPEIKNIKFVVLNNEQLQKLDKDVHHFSHIEREGRKYSVWYGFGNPVCGDSFGDTWSVRYTSGRIRIWKDGGAWGSGGCSTRGPSY